MINKVKDWKVIEQNSEEIIIEFFYQNIYLVNVFAVTGAEF